MCYAHEDAQERPVTEKMATQPVDGPPVEAPEDIDDADPADVDNELDPDEDEQDVETEVEPPGDDDGSDDEE